MAKIQERRPRSAPRRIEIQPYRLVRQMDLLPTLRTSRRELQAAIDGGDREQALRLFQAFKDSLDRMLRLPNLSKLHWRPPESYFRGFQIPPPYGVPGRSIGTHVICNLNVERIIEGGNYWDDGGTGGGDAQPGTGKNAGGGVWSHPTLDPGPETVSFGFISTVQVPAAQSPTSVVIQSSFSAGVGWAEANTFPGTYAHIYAHSGLAAAYEDQRFTAPLQTVLEYRNDTPETVIPAEQFGWRIGRGLTLDFDVPAGAERIITITEWATMQADASNGFASLSLGFHWAPLVVSLRQGCRVIQSVDWGYWSGGNPDRGSR